MHLFTGDAHILDVTDAAKKFLSYSDKFDRFKYVDVPHHGSWPSNGIHIYSTDKEKEHVLVNNSIRGLAQVPADHYLLSHNGQNVTPSPLTIADILTTHSKDPEFHNLHFVYPRRKNTKSQRCAKCGCDKLSWSCTCVKDGHECTCIQKALKGKIDTQPSDMGNFKFFPLK